MSVVDLMGSHFRRAGQEQAVRDRLRVRNLSWLTRESSARESAFQILQLFNDRPELRFRSKRPVLCRRLVKHERCVR